MGKRKRIADVNRTSSPSDLMLHSPHMDMKQKYFHQVDCSATQSVPSIMNIMDSSMKIKERTQSPSTYNHGPSRALLLSHSRKYSGRHYSRRCYTNRCDPSISNWKASSAQDMKISFKMASKNQSDSQYEESTETQFPIHKEGKMRSNSLARNGASDDVRKIECLVCRKRLRKKPFGLENSTLESDVPVVAVLTCGHVYHADCLEQNTSYEDRRDPPCPLCASLTLQVTA